MDQIVELIKQCLGGSKHAWDTFVGDYSRWIYHCILSTAHRYGRRISNDDTDELCQDVFVILLDKGLKQFNGQNKPCFLAYLRRIAVCHTINYLKRSGKYVAIEEAQADGGAYARLIKDLETSAPQRELERLATADELKHLLDRLSADERHILEMCYFDQLSPREIAAKFSITVDAYYVRKNRVLNKLRHHAVQKQVSPACDEENHG